MQLFKKAVPIWSISSGEVSDQYRIFRKKFTIDTVPEKMWLDIAANTTFCVTVNGTRLRSQQLAGFPGDVSVSRHDIAGSLIAGENIVACEVHYIGMDFFTCFAGTAFLCLEIHGNNRVFAATDESWKCAASPDMYSGLNCRVSPQLGVVFCKDARKSIAWETADFDDSAWQDAVKTADCGKWKYSLRKVPQLVELPGTDRQCVPQFGYIKRAAEEETFAMTAFHDFFSPRRPEEFFELDMSVAPPRIWAERGTDLVLKQLPDGVDGYCIIIDTGREQVGFPELDITAPEGAVIDICHGEHLEDGRVRSRIGPRNFTDRFITKSGRNKLFYNHRRLGLRYLELHITNCSASQVILHYAGITRLELPLPAQTVFNAPDRFISKLNDLSCETLKLCMHEHYEDCPWREQALYAYDSRNQMLYGYYVWGNYDFAAASLDLLGKSFDGRDYIDLISPGESGLTIPIFTMVWITALYEHALFSGSTELVTKYLAQVDTIINSALSRTIAEAPGLYHTGSGKRIWNFCEWNGRLSRLTGHPQAAYNIYLFEALNSAAKMHDIAGNSDRRDQLSAEAKVLGRAVEEYFYNSSKKFYAPCRTMPEEEQPGFEMNNDSGNADCDIFDDGYEHIQQIMLANGLVPAERLSGVLDNILSGRLKEIDFSAFIYLISGMMKSGSKTRSRLAEKLLAAFECMVYNGATSLWETGEVFDRFGGGSLCHAWSSVMPYFCKHCVLGVTPLELGFKKFEVKPFPAGLSEASGTIPTPHGNISVAWKTTDSGLDVRIEHPENLECVTSSYEECGKVNFNIIRVSAVSDAQALVYPAPQN